MPHAKKWNQKKSTAVRLTGLTYDQAREKYVTDATARGVFDRILCYRSKDSTNPDRIGPKQRCAHHNDPVYGTAGNPDKAQLWEYYVDTRTLRVIARTANYQTSYFLCVHTGAFNGFQYYSITDGGLVRTKLATAAENLRAAQPTTAIPAVNNQGQNVAVQANTDANPAPTVAAQVQAIQGQPMVVVLANNNANGPPAEEKPAVPDG
jgi:hypothetical protein